MTQSPPPPPTDILSSIDQRALPQVKIAWPHESFKRVSLNLSAAAFPKTPPSTSLSHSHSLDSTEDANEFLETLQNRPSSIHSSRGKVVGVGRLAVLGLSHCRNECRSPFHLEPFSRLESLTCIMHGPHLTTFCCRFL